MEIHNIIIGIFCWFALVVIIVIATAIHDSPKRRMLNILYDTVNFYNSKNRATLGTSGCFYHVDGIKCAVGRLLNNKDLERIHESNLNTSVNVEDLNYVLKYFTSEKIIGLPISFLSDLQFLHDDYTRWNEKGLSKKGTVKFLEIKRSIKEGDYIKGACIVGKDEI